MSIASLSIRGFRNLHTNELRFSPQLNLFVGENAAGKTSLLEALFVLARGRSFRTSRLDELIQSNQEDFQIVAQLHSSTGGQTPVGMRRREGRLECRIDSRPIKRLSQLATLFPVQWLGGNLHTLIEDGPVYRRQFLDWGLFHVKPDYVSQWKRFHKLLKQRNAALRKNAACREVQAWDSELAGVGAKLDVYRRDYLFHLLGAMQAINSRFLTLKAPVSVSYRRGWSDGQSYLEQLETHLQRDRERGFTGLGPHRAELIFSVDNKPVSKQLSRGQQKVFITTLQLAQASLLYQQTGKSSLFLLDDLGSELDSNNQRIILDLLGGMNAQVFVTSIEEPPLPDCGEGQVRRFHVKHGVVSEMV
jgi:DNA replication and repair protein RecF